MAARKSIDAVVTRGGRLDLTKEPLAGLDAATLCIVGAEDTQLLAPNRTLDQLRTEKE